MSTRSLIAIKEGTSYRSIYCHSDGYPSHVGRILQEHYTDDDKIKKLIALGGLSVLDREIGTKHGFGERPEGECTVYNRDRGDDLHIGVHNSEKDLFESFKESWCEWLYVWQDGKWYCLSTYDHDSGTLRPLHVEAEEEACEHQRTILNG